MTGPDRTALERVNELRAFVGETERVPILVQEDPDPDGMATALGVRVLLHRIEDDSPIISLGEITRPENRRMAEMLGIRVTRVTPTEVEGFEKVIAVDTQPRGFRGPPPRMAIIDHHPPLDSYPADFADIRPDYGAAATVITEYLRADGESQVHQKLATALLYGIRTDTDTLMRGATAPDVIAYAFLQDRVDQVLLRRVSRASFQPDCVRAFGRALAAVVVEDHVAVAYLGRLLPDEGHILPILAEFCLALESVAWGAAAAVIEDEVALAIRRTGTAGPGAGQVARLLSEEPGKGGGHATMARAALPKKRLGARSEEPGAEGPSRSVLALVLGAIARAGEPSDPAD